MWLGPLVIKKMLLGKRTGSSLHSEPQMQNTVLPFKACPDQSYKMFIITTAIKIWRVWHHNSLQFLRLLKLWHSKTTSTKPAGPDQHLNTWSRTRPDPCPCAGLQIRTFKPFTSCTWLNSSFKVLTFSPPSFCHLDFIDIRDLDQIWKLKQCDSLHLDSIKILCAICSQLFSSQLCRILGFLFVSKRL